MEPYLTEIKISCERPQEEAIGHQDTSVGLWLSCGLVRPFALEIITVIKY
jgi:hypothetical protein